MPTKITILCPYHATEEEITIPDTYIGTAYAKDKPVIFEGDLPCNPKNPQKRYCILHMRIHFQSAKTPWVEQIVKKQ